MGEVIGDPFAPQPDLNRPRIMLSMERVDGTTFELDLGYEDARQFAVKFNQLLAEAMRQVPRRTA